MIALNEHAWFILRRAVFRLRWGIALALLGGVGFGLGCAALRAHRALLALPAVSAHPIRRVVALGRPVEHGLEWDRDFWRIDDAALSSGIHLDAVEFGSTASTSDVCTVSGSGAYRLVRQFLGAVSRPSSPIVLDTVSLEPSAAVPGDVVFHASFRVMVR